MEYQEEKRCLIGKMNNREDSDMQKQFVEAVKEEDLRVQLELLSELLQNGFTTEVNAPIPSIDQTPLQLCVSQLTDRHHEFFTLLLQASNEAEQSRVGRSAFDCLVPICMEKLGMMYELLDGISEPERQAHILGCILTSAPSSLKSELCYRLPSMYPSAWKLIPQLRTAPKVA